MYLGCHLHFPCVRVPLLSRWKNFPEMIWQLVHYQNLFTSSTSKCSKQCGYNSFLTKRCVEPGETYHIQFSNWDPDASPMMPQAKQRKKNSVIPYQENRLFRISYLREAFLGLICALALHVPDKPNIAVAHLGVHHAPRHSPLHLYH